MTSTATPLHLPRMFTRLQQRVAMSHGSNMAYRLTGPLLIMLSPVKMPAQQNEAV